MFGRKICACTGAANCSSALSPMSGTRSFASRTPNGNNGRRRRRPCDGRHSQTLTAERARVTVLFERWSACPAIDRWFVMARKYAIEYLDRLPGGETYHDLVELSSA